MTDVQGERPCSCCVELHVLGIQRDGTPRYRIHMS